MIDDTCIMRKATGPWYNRRQSIATVICGLAEAEQYAKAGYQFDWQAMREDRLRKALSTVPHKEEATPAPQDDGMVLLPRVMTAAMINAWSGGLTVSSDENAGRTTFQDAWQRVIEAATPATTTTERGRG